jgi:hypothetical protein
MVASGKGTRTPALRWRSPRGKFARTVVLSFPPGGITPQPLFCHSPRGGSSQQRLRRSFPRPAGVSRALLERSPRRWRASAKIGPNPAARRTREATAESVSRARMARTAGDDAIPPWTGGARGTAARFAPPRDAARRRIGQRSPRGRGGRRARGGSCGGRLLIERGDAFTAAERREKSSSPRSARAPARRWSCCKFRASMPSSTTGTAIMPARVKRPSSFFYANRVAIPSPRGTLLPSVPLARRGDALAAGRHKKTTRESHQLSRMACRNPIHPEVTT